MKNEVRRFLSAFLLVNVIICCLTMILSGKITVEESAAKILYDQSAQVIKISKEKENVSLFVDRREIISDSAVKRLLDKYNDFIMLSPAAPIKYLFESVKGFLY